MNGQRYRPIADYGLIGDCRTAALVGPDGSVDWFCWPRFDAPAVFARILDADRGGFWRVAPATGEHDGMMRYRQDTAVLETEHRTPDGVVRVVDAMTAPDAVSAGEAIIMRLVEGVEGSVEVVSVLDARPGFGEAETSSTLTDSTADIFGDGFSARLAITGGNTSATSAGAAVVHRFTVHPGDRVALTLSCGAQPGAPADVGAAIDRCAAWWADWCARCDYAGEYQQPVLRSAVTLKLMTHQDAGVIVAAPTASLPEEIGGERNWDYRFAWLRDASLTVYALLATGQRDVAQPFMRWVCDRVGQLVDVEDLRIMYTVDGSAEMPERILEQFEGYQGSRPVRIGNAAVGQLQLDVYGEVLECLRVCDAYGVDVATEVWPDFRRVVEWVAGNWRRPDNGIWEVRGGRRHFVHSKVMAWVALDRGATFAERHGEVEDAARWRREADELHAEVLDRGWSDKLQAFKQSYDEELLDAANLQIPLMGFLPPDDPRVHATIDATVRDLAVNGLVYRYRGTDDGLAGGEGAFLMATFWLVSALAVCGRHQEARAMFENALRSCAPLGLLAEEVDPQTGQALGNYPQAFTHIGLIGAAVDLARAGASDATISTHKAGI